MDKEDRDPWRHVIGAVKGLAIGTAVSLVAGAFEKYLGSVGQLQANAAIFFLHLQMHVI
jgi:hypothetical protein